VGVGRVRAEIRAREARVRAADQMAAGRTAQARVRREDRAAGLTKFLTQFNSAGRFWVGVVVIAIVPAVSEELVFRGVIQKNLVRWFSPHVGVWLGAAIFSAIHFQFFGFVPRFVLGLALGYLYLWSGNILVSMAAHFTQNAFQLLILYLTQRGQFGWGFDPDANEALPWPLVLLSVKVNVARCPPPGRAVKLVIATMPTLSEVLLMNRNWPGWMVSRMLA